MSTLTIAVPVPLRRHFDYLPPAGIPSGSLQPGVRLRVPFGRRELTGVLLGTNPSPSTHPQRLREAIACLDEAPALSPSLLALGQRLAAYYQHPIGEVFATLLPASLRKNQPGPDFSPAVPVCPPLLVAGRLTLNTDQTRALAAIQEAGETFRVFLLEGVTGSGKTEVYLQAMESVLAAGRQVLILVPEIGLTPQALRCFQERFSWPVIALHSRTQEKKRFQHWQAVATGEARIIIGTRSAVFLPFKNPGLIIIDEEHDLSFKQQDHFRYHARDVALMRAQAAGLPVILGSATPSLESVHNAHTGRYQHVLLEKRAGNASLPAFQLTDIRRTVLSHGLSPLLLQTVKQHLSAGSQVMLFLNRRGFAPALLCHACGWVASCSRCDIRMTLHRGSSCMLCHHCERRARIPLCCGECGEKTLEATGQGTERLEENLVSLFPDIPIVRIDRDSTRRKGSMEKALDSIHRGHARLLAGTQMLAKGHHFPAVTLACILDADGGLFSADFRGPERMGQLLLQVAGRAGRAEKPGTVMIQTHHPDHPLLGLLLQEGYPAFAAALLTERQLAGLPPFAHLALIRAESSTPEPAMQFLAALNRETAAADPGLSVMGPVPAPLPKRAGKYRFQLLFSARQRRLLHDALNRLLPVADILPAGRKVRWSVDVDPLEMT